MHIAPKIVLSIGGILFIGGLIGLFIGGNLFTDVEMDSESEDWSGTLMWEGNTPTTYEDEFKWNTMYNVWVETGSEVEIEVNSDSAKFVSCSDLDDCWIYDVDGAIDGFDYIGEIVVENTDKLKISFTESNGENVGVMIREERVPYEAGLGLLSCCCGVFVLLFGAILAFTVKDKKKSTFVSYVPIESDANSSSSNEEKEDFNEGTETEEEWWKNSDT